MSITFEEKTKKYKVGNMYMNNLVAKTVSVTKEQAWQHCSV